MTALWLLAPLVLGQAVAVEIEVLSLTGAFSARTPGGSARARAGEPLPALPAGSAVTVEEGEAVFRALGAVISASPRQSFSVREAPGGAHLEFLGPGTLSARLGGARVWLSPGALLWFDGRAGFALAAGEGEYAPAGAGGRRALRKGKPVEAPAAPALDDASDPLALPEPESSTPTLRLTLGALELIPYYRAALLYDDNIYRVPTPSTGSWITESSLGASAALPGAGTTASSSATSSRPASTGWTPERTTRSTSGSRAPISSGQCPSPSGSRTATSPPRTRRPPRNR